MKNLISFFKKKTKKDSIEHALRIYNGKFAFCGASGAEPTGKIIEVQGKKFKEGRSICPVMNGPSIANIELVSDPSTTPDGTENTVWSFFWYYDEVPQAPSWETLPTVNRSFVIGQGESNQMSNMFCMPCRIFKNVNGVDLAECFGPLNEMAIPLRKSVRVRPGQTSITQAPEGS
ncbi:MAG: hypothetical protein EBS55_13275, partial [Flavobacteriaceae bacterium]|nr:hypothetical protein [Flavobacteriaceae bacterium]